ncbi:MAG: sensor histidine kinase [Dethiobacteria bacterium]|jgi:signal transduction histidine kinase
MNLKKRLFLANFATVAVPLAITILVAAVYLFFSGRYAAADLSFDRYRQLSAIKHQFFYNQSSSLLEHPETIEKESKQKEILTRLEKVDGELVILKNGEPLFSSCELSPLDLAKLLQNGNSLGDNGEVVINNVSFLMQMTDLLYRDGSRAQVVLLAPMQGSGADLKKFLWLMGITFLLSFLLINFFASRQISRAILEPIGNLQVAAGEISKGNLQHQIVEEGDPEIQGLCRDLEMMRIKLIELIHTQLKDEDNRKMLIGNISHDLKTPVTSIKGYVEGILDGVADSPEKRGRYLKTIYLKAEQIDGLIDDLVLFYKLDLKQVPFQMEKTNIAEYLRRCMAENRPGPDRDRVTFRFTDELGQNRYVLFDREQMSRVIMNIIDNSLKYLPQGQGEIHILLRETKTSVIMEFRDNGCGIKEKDLPHVFERFYRGDHSRTGIKGSGLGLAISKQIVEGNNGRIWAVSPPEGGTAIMISFGKL